MFCGLPVSRAGVFTVRYRCDKRVSMAWQGASLKFYRCCICISTADFDDKVYVIYTFLQDYQITCPGDNPCCSRALLPLAFDREHVSWFWGKQIDTNRYKNTYEKTTRFSYKRTFLFVPGTAVYRAMCTVRLLIPAATVQPGWITPGHDHVQPRFSVRHVEINVFYEYSYLFSVFSTCFSVFSSCFLRTWFVSVRWFYHRFVSICIDFVSIFCRFFVDFCSGNITACI